MLRRIAARPSVHLGRDYMIRLYDDFEVCGPNGKHEVFVIEVTGPTLDEMISSASDPETDHLPDTLVRRWARQLLLSLGYLATEGIVHGGASFAYPSHLLHLLLAIGRVLAES